MDDVVIVGPCAAGKSTLARGLRTYGLIAQPVAQEHSGVKGLWQHHAAHALVYLDVDLEQVHQRGRPGFPAWLHQQQHIRLQDARTAAHLYLDTSSLTVPQVLEHVLTFLRQHSPPR